MPQKILAGRTQDFLTQPRQILKYDNEEILILYHQQKFYAVQAHCPHAGLPLIEGDIEDPTQLRCPWHAWCFDLTTGKELDGCGDGLKIYFIEVRGNEVWLEV